MDSTPLVFLDACCLINLFATDCVEEILGSLPYRWAVAQYVVDNEVLEIGVEDEASDPGRGRRSIHPLLEKVVADGLVQSVEITSSEEAAEFVRFARRLDDGEAHTCALARVREAGVATDDKKAIRVWEEEGAEAKAILRTSELLFEWADAQATERQELVRIARAIARQASFFPPRSDPNFDRWMRLLQ